MPTDPAPEKKPDQEPIPQESYIPKPPSPEAIEEISQQQALITDEWTGDAPGTAGEHSPADEERRPTQP